jgi:molybdenum cofactor cytidylyltransferase
MARLAAVVLAAGASRRFGERNKLLAQIAGTPLVRRAVEAMLAGGISETVVVTGHDADGVKTALAGMPVRFEHNSNWEAGIGASIAAGIAALSADTEGAFIVPGDMPFIDPDVLGVLAEAFASRSPAPVVFPATPEGEQRNPVLWPRRHFAELRLLAGAEGAKRLLQSLADESVAVRIPGPQPFVDIDTEADLSRAATDEPR